MALAAVAVAAGTDVEASDIRTIPNWTCTRVVSRPFLDVADPYSIENQLKLVPSI